MTKNKLGDDPVNLIYSFPNNISYLFDDIDSALRQIYKQYKGESTDLRNSLVNNNSFVLFICKNVAKLNNHYFVCFSL